MRSTVDAKTVRTIKAHKAYKKNVAREGEANVTLIANPDGTFTIDDWGCENSGYGRPFADRQLDHIELSQALFILAAVNKRARLNNYYSVAWNMEGL